MADISAGRPVLAVLASGHGSNLQALIDSIAQNILMADLAVVVVNVASAYARKRAIMAGIPCELCLSVKGEARVDYDHKLLSILSRYEVNWVILAGYMRILSAMFVSRYQGHILNIHPSLLPKYPGLDAIDRALAAGDRELGVTIHRVDAGVDSGPVLCQGKIRIGSGEDTARVVQRIHQLEHYLYPRVIDTVIRSDM